MPLLDHFHGVLQQRRHWHAFHNAWATLMALDLNERLPDPYFAEASVQFSIEIDVATWEAADTAGPSRPTGGIATAQRPATWLPPAPALSFPFARISDAVEVHIFDSTGGPTLAAAIELVSPANKDRESHRDAFITKCASYLQTGAGLAIVDIVTTRQANLHRELIQRIGGDATLAIDAPLYATAYHVVSRDDIHQVDLWEQRLALGEPLPTIPLWIHGGLCLPLNLETTYMKLVEGYKLGEV